MHARSKKKGAKGQADTLPIGSRPSLFLIGRDSRGSWVVQDQRGLCGGLFISHAEALKFALFENGNRPEAVITVPGVLELDMSASAWTADQAAVN